MKVINKAMKQIIERCLLIFQTSGLGGIWSLICELRAENKRLNAELKRLKSETEMLEKSAEELKKIINKKP